MPLPQIHEINVGHAFQHALELAKALKAKKPVPPAALDSYCRHLLIKDFGHAFLQEGYGPFLAALGKACEKLVSTPPDEAGALAQLEAGLFGAAAARPGEFNVNLLYDLWPAHPRLPEFVPAMSQLTPEQAEKLGLTTD